MFIKFLNEVDGADIPLVGGKGVNLGELEQVKLPVPAAFCVTTGAYNQFVVDNDLGRVMAAKLDGVDYEDVVDLAKRAEAIRDEFIAMPMPAAAEEAIRAAYAGLEKELGDNVLVSVRSSATAEDLPGMSFAGQQDTYLNIGGIDNVLHHVKRCWASLWTDRAIAYRHRQGFKHEEVLLAVVVQEMFSSEIAGVMFTANPLTSNPNEAFVNSSWGLGEAVVSGKVNPDQYIIDKQSKTVVSKVINEKLIMTAKKADGAGSEEVEVPADLRKKESLTAAQLAELTEIATGIEAHYGYPQDIEWGYSNGRFAILQSREVTAADLDFAYELEAYQTPAAREAITDERWTWSRAYSDEFQTGPSTPVCYSFFESGMTLIKHAMFRIMGVKSVFRMSKGETADIPMYRWYGARAYFNLEIERERIRRFIPPFARDDAALWPFPEKDREEIRNMPFKWIPFVWRLILLRIAAPGLSLTKSTKVMYEGATEVNQKSDAYWAKRDLETCSAEELLKGNDELMAIVLRVGATVILPFTIYLFVLPPGLRKLCKSWLGDEDGTIFGALLSGLGTKTGEENIMLWKLAQILRKSSSLTDIVLSDGEVEAKFTEIKASTESAEFMAELEKFLQVAGQRGGAERDPYHKRYSHEPSKVLVPIQAMLREGDSANPEVMERRLAERMKQTKEECIKKLKRQGLLGWFKARFFEWFVELTQDWAYFRDFERFYFDRNYARARDHLEVLGARFVKRGLLTDPEAIFFLGIEEAIEADEGKLAADTIEARVRARRRVYDRYSHKEPPKYIKGWTFWDDDELEDDGNGLRGLPASGGTVTGRARVCRKLDEIGKVEKGDILVSVGTDPGWTSLFSMLGGVVVETGGVVAHAVLISREFGVPCVANLSGACDLIPDGAVITVDGTNGRVVIHDDESAAADN